MDKDKDTNKENCEECNKDGPITIMSEQKKKDLESKGFKSVTVKEFLNLSDDEAKAAGL